MVVSLRDEGKFFSVRVVYQNREDKKSASALFELRKGRQNLEEEKKSSDFFEIRKDRVESRMSACESLLVVEVFRKPFRFSLSGFLNPSTASDFFGAGEFLRPLAARGLNLQAVRPAVA